MAEQVGEAATNTGTTVEQQRDRLRHLGQQVQAFGAAMCAQLLLSGCCNNHACMSLEGANEGASVKGLGCTGCRAAYYCTKQCHCAH